MSELHFSLDIDRVQSSVNAAIRPAVEAALATMDIKKIVADKLCSKNEPPEDDFYSRMFGRRRMDPSSLIDRLVNDSIEEMAKHYVKSQVTELQGEIEEGFRKMMQGSTNRLVKSFSKAVEKALKEDWAFKLNVQVTHECEDGDDD